MNFKAFLFQTTYHRRRPLLELLFRSIFCHIVHFLLEERCGLRFSRFRKFDWGLLGLIVKKFFIDPLKTDLIAWQMITHIFLYRLWISFLKHLVDLISHFTLNLFIINFPISIKNEWSICPTKQKHTPTILHLPRPTTPSTPNYAIPSTTSWNISENDRNSSTSSSRASSALHMK